MTPSERTIMQAVLRYNGVPDSEMDAHIEMSREEGRGSLNRHAYRSYRIIWNAFTNAQKRELTAHHCRVTQ